MKSSSPDHAGPGILPGVSTYRAVQISGATSPQVAINPGQRSVLCCSVGRRPRYWRHTEQWCLGLAI